MKYVIDRIEGDIVVAQDSYGNITNISKSMVKGKIREKVVIEKVDDFYVVLEEETTHREEYIKSITKDMWKN